MSVKGNRTTTKNGSQDVTRSNLDGLDAVFEIGFWAGFKGERNTIEAYACQVDRDDHRAGHAAGSNERERAYAIARATLTDRKMRRQQSTTGQGS
jgi:hypothetical protein